MDFEVFLNSVEEASSLVGWYCKVIMMDIQREILLNIHALKRDQDQERLSSKGSSSVKPLIYHFDITEQSVQS